ncbi:hypothetical protein N8T08_007782 [Aspergillus melleus]|uniref:Uncharacterized protein n=1 Tax=Aspergillus melleus TaxID=138277 RepID=A0ACC3BE74_9EURO|nr:hypothetical protein N8T08_007782 [Aspergillus melleus]
MQFSIPTLLIAALGLSTTAFTAAIPDTKHSVSEYRWHGCAAGVYCTSDNDSAGLNGQLDARTVVPELSI